MGKRRHNRQQNKKQQTNGRHQAEPVGNELVPVKPKTEGTTSTKSDKAGAPSRTSFGWRKVDVSTLAEQGDAGERWGDDDEMKRLQNNHYDNPSLQKLADRELDAFPQEATAIFFGLEVLDGDAYSVRQDPTSKHKFMVLKGQDDGDNGDKAIERNKEETSLEPRESSKKVTRDKPSRKHDKKELLHHKGQKRKRVEQDVGDVKEKVTKDHESETYEDEKEEQQEHEARNPSDKNPKMKRKKKKMSNIQQKAKETEQESRDEDDCNNVTTNPADKEAEASASPPEQVLSLQTAWAAQTGGVTLHERLCESLLRQGFWSPTPIQAATLPPAILGRRNLVGAAPTGSGKTLAFLLPIGQALLEQQEQQRTVEDHMERPQRSLQALILTPTRELALQIQTESDKLLGKHMACTLVGGLAHVKQTRVLESKRSPIVVATPGRLWELMSGREHEHLNDLSQIRFLVIDEADRMIQQGSFPQLSTILDAIQRANPMDSDDDDDSEDEGMQDDEDGRNGAGRLLGLPGIPGEAKLVTLSDKVMAGIERQRRINTGSVKEPEVKELDDDDEFEQQVQDQKENGVQDGADDDGSHQISLPTRPPVHRQTFVYSATLTLPASANFTKRNPDKKKRLRYKANVDGAIAEILEKSRAKGKTKVVDLSIFTKKKMASEMAYKSKTDNNKTNNEAAATRNETFRLPEGLSLRQIKCSQRHKDSHLYAYLMTTAEGSSGPCLVFCNSIAGVRRVGATLQALGLDVRILHAQMQQRARFKAVELLQQSKKQTVVVATDVAARGLDIPSVASVVHYDTARTVDAFIHRSGRTARGVGPKAVGCSLSLVSPDEDRMVSNTARALNLQFETVSMDCRLLQEAQERVNLASKVAEVEDTERKSLRQNQWLKEKAAAAGFELDEDLLNEGLSGGDQRERAKLMEAQRARERLKMLLGQPMRTQRFGKFLSTNSALKQAATMSFFSSSGSSKTGTAAENSKSSRKRSRRVY